MQTLDEIPLAEDIDDLAAHAGHDAHVDHHIGRIAQLHADLGDGRTQRPHAEGDDIHGTPLHAAVEQTVEGLLHGLGVFPIVGGARVFLAQAADEGTILHPGHVAGIGKTGKAVGAFFRVEPDEGPLIHQLAGKEVVFLLRAVAPVDRVRFAQIRHLLNPTDQGFIPDLAGIVGTGD